MLAANSASGRHDSERAGRILIGGVGYRNLRDGSIGPWVTDTLADRAGGALEVEDVSYHPVGLSQNLTDRPPYDRMVLVGAVRRGRRPATIEGYRWNGDLPDPDEIQSRVAEAVTGVISLENTLVVCAALGGLPDDVRVVEVEPADDGWGEEFSPQVEEKLPEILEAVWSSTRP